MCARVGVIGRTVRNGSDGSERRDDRRPQSAQIAPRNFRGTRPNFPEKIGIEGSSFWETLDLLRTRCARRVRETFKDHATAEKQKPRATHAAHQKVERRAQATRSRAKYRRHPMIDAILASTCEYCANTWAFGKARHFGQVAIGANRHITDKRCGERVG